MSEIAKQRCERQRHRRQHEAHTEEDCEIAGCPLSVRLAAIAEMTAPDKQKDGESCEEGGRDQHRAPPSERRIMPLRHPFDYVSRHSPTPERCDRRAGRLPTDRGRPAASEVRHSARQVQPYHHGGDQERRAGREGMSDQRYGFAIDEQDEREGRTGDGGDEHSAPESAKTNALILNRALSAGEVIADTYYSELASATMSRFNADTGRDWDFDRWGDRLKLSGLFLTAALAVDWVGQILIFAW